MMTVDDSASSGLSDAETVLGLDDTAWHTSDLAILCPDIVGETSPQRSKIGAARNCLPQLLCLSSLMFFVTCFNLFPFVLSNTFSSPLVSYLMPSC